MSIRVVGSLTLLTLLASCASTEGARPAAGGDAAAPGTGESTLEGASLAEDGDRPAEDRGVDASIDRATPGAAEAVSAAEGTTREASSRSSASRRQGPETPRARARRFAAALDVWNTPTFRRKLAESLASDADIEPTVTADEQELLLEVFDLLAEEDEVKAEAAAREALSILRSERQDTSSAVLDFWIGVLHLQFEELDEARPAFERAVARFPNFRRAWARLGQLQFRNQELEAARESFQSVLRLGGVEGSVYGLLGACHSALGDYLAAESAFRMATLLEPELIDWKYGLAESFGFQGKFADAVALFAQLIEAQPDNPDFWMAQGQAYARLKQQMRAAENFEMVDQLGGSTASSLSNLGALYSNQGLYDLAVGAYRRALVLDPTMNVDPLLLAANFLSGNGAQREASDLLSAIQDNAGPNLSDGDRKELLRLQSRIAASRGDSEGKVDVLLKIIELDPLDGDALISLGDHYYRADDPDQAEFFFKQAEEIPEFERAAKIGRAQLLARQQRYADAMPLLERAQAIESTDRVQRFIEQLKGAMR